MRNRIAIALFIAVYVYTVLWLEHRITVLERIAMDFTIEFRYKSHFPAVGEFGTIQLYKEDSKKVDVDDWDAPKIMPRRRKKLFGRYAPVRISPNKIKHSAHEKKS